MEKQRWQFMRLVFNRFVLMAAVLLWPVAALSVPASLKSREYRLPAPQLEDRSGKEKFAPLLLFACLNALSQGKITEGKEFCTQALSIDPQLADAYKMRGYGYLLERRFERARTDFQAAVRLEPQDADSLAGYGQSLSGMGLFREAIVQLEKAVALSPAKAPYWNGLCWARAGTGNNLKRALADCNRALALQPGAVAAFTSRGTTRLRLRQFSAAIADYDAALKTRAELPSALYGRGLARLNLGQIVHGAADISNARRGDADIDDLFVTLGIVPRSCAHPAGKAVCPSGFPSRPESQEGNYRLFGVSLQQDPDQDMMLAIEVGRLDLMVSQIAHLSRQPKLVRPKGQRPFLTAGIPEQISATAERFNKVLSAACKGHRLGPRYCSPYHPVDAKASRSGLTAAVDALFDRIYPVWRAVCASNRRHCQLE